MQSSVIYVLLKFVVDWVDGQVAFLEPKETAVLFSFSVRLLQIYSAHNIGKVCYTFADECVLSLFSDMCKGNVHVFYELYCSYFQQWF
jgi:hypothetical protein